jgi:hypothetical protein
MASRRAVRAEWWQPAVLGPSVLNTNDFTAVTLLPVVLRNCQYRHVGSCLCCNRPFTSKTWVGRRIPECVKSFTQRGTNE